MAFMKPFRLLKLYQLVFWPHLVLFEVCAPGQMLCLSRLISATRTWRWTNKRCARRWTIFVRAPVDTFLASPESSYAMGNRFHRKGSPSLLQCTPGVAYSSSHPGLGSQTYTQLGWCTSPLRLTIVGIAPPWGQESVNLRHCQGLSELGHLEN